MKAGSIAMDAHTKYRSFTDPKELRELPTFPPHYIRTGTKVKAIFHNGRAFYGNGRDRADVENHLSHEKIYTVNRTTGYGLNHTVYLEEVPGVGFKSICLYPHEGPQEPMTEQEFIQQTKKVEKQGEERIEQAKRQAEEEIGELNRRYALANSKVKEGTLFIIDKPTHPYRVQSVEGRVSNYQGTFVYLHHHIGRLDVRTGEVKEGRYSSGVMHDVDLEAMTPVPQEEQQAVITLFQEEKAGKRVKVKKWITKLSVALKKAKRWEELRGHSATIEPFEWKATRRAYR